MSPHAHYEKQSTQAPTFIHIQEQATHSAYLSIFFSEFLQHSLFFHHCILHHQSRQHSSLSRNQPLLLILSLHLNTHFFFISNSFTLPPIVLSLTHPPKGHQHSSIHPSPEINHLVSWSIKAPNFYSWLLPSPIPLSLIYPPLPSLCKATDICPSCAINRYYLLGPSTYS